MQLELQVFAMLLMCRKVEMSLMAEQKETSFQKTGMQAVAVYLQKPAES